MDAVPLILRLTYGVLTLYFLVAMTIGWLRTGRLLGGGNVYGVIAFLLAAAGSAACVVRGGGDLPTLSRVCAGLLTTWLITVHVAMGLHCAAATDVAGFAFLPGGRRPGFDVKSWTVAVLAIIAGSMVFTVALFKLLPPRVQLAPYLVPVGALFRLPARIHVTPALIGAVMLIALVEELLFRGGVQNYVAWRLGGRAHKAGVAVVLAAFLWTLGHTAILDPYWLKGLQIFPIGLGLGWLALRYGLEASILAHAVFNVLILFPGPSLVAGP
jgi:membrane protease YdiL (CAAX protease family)